MSTFKTTFIFVLTFIFFSFNSYTSAHTYTGSIAPSGLTNRHDLIQVSCFSYANGVHPLPLAPEVNGPANRFIASLGGTGSGLTIQALPGGAVVNNVATAQSHATQHSAGTFARPNNGVYFVKINRAAPSGIATAFTASFYCVDSFNGPVTGTGEGFAGDVGNVQPLVDYNVLINQ